MTPSARRALLIGIGPYPHLPPLGGCINDVRLMRAVLRDTFGFADEHCIQLENEQATRAGILAAFEQLITAIGRDDIVVIHYAGHGGQMTDREFDEPSGLDSTLQPWDTEGWRGENRDITDDEIALLLERIGEKTRFLTLIVDACHSGTITRDGTGPAARGTPADRRPIDQLPPSPIPVEKRTGPTASGPSGWLPITEKYVLISGCRDDELSYECFPNEGGGATTHGALTYFLAKSLVKATPGTTYRDIFERVASQVNATNALQHPQMEGKADREIFGVTEFVPARYLRVLARDGVSLTLGAGGAQGVTVGSQYAIHAAGAKTADAATRLGSVEVTAVSVVSAEARIVDETTPDSIGVESRAFETKHAFGDFRLPVVITRTPAGEADGLRAVLDASSLVSVVEPTVPMYVTITLLPARATVHQGDPVPRAGALAAPMWAVVSEAGHLMMPLKPLGDEQVIRENLELLARYRQALELENPNPDSVLRGKFTLELLTRSASGEWVVAQPEQAGGQVVFTEGDAVGFRIRSTHDTPVFFSLIDFEVNGAVTPLRPSARSGTSQLKLSENQKVDIGPEMKSAPRITWPKGFPYVDNASQEDEAVETVKLFLTQEPADFSVLAQGPTRAGVQRTALGELLNSAMQGRPVSRVAMEPERTDDWTTVQRSFVVRRRTSAALPADGSAVAIGDATITAPGLVGTAQAFLGGSGRRQADGQLAPPVHDALADAGMTVRRTVAIENARETGPASRGDDSMALTVPAPPSGCGQLVMATDELGVVSWHVAEPSRTAGSRGDVAAAEPTRRYLVPRAVPTETAVPGSRGMVAVLGKKLLKELVFPLIDPIIGEVSATFVNRMEAAKWPYRVRAFDPGTHADDTTAAFDGAAWARVSRTEGRALLFLHGTFSRSHLAFGTLPTPVMQELHSRYGGRVFAFDHFTLSHDPKENIRRLISLIPEGTALDVDIVAHSRGGLVARVLSEQLSNLSMGRRSIRVGQAVFVGSPNAGTGLADPQRISTLLDLVTNVVNLIPGPGVTDILSTVLGVLKQVAVGAFEGLDGLMAMDPDGTFATEMNTGAPTEGTRYRAIAANVTPVDPGLMRFVMARALGQLLSGTHDLVVPTESCFGANGSGGFPIADRLVLEGSEAVSHTKYFSDLAVHRQLLDWLSAE
jgi:hypothetical protein